MLYSKCLFLWDIYCPQMKYVFTRVCHSVHREAAYVTGVCAWQLAPLPCMSPSTPLSLPHTHPYNMRSMSGWEASFWNAFLFYRNVFIKLCVSPFVVHYVEYWIVSNETDTDVRMYICFIN